MIKIIDDLLSQEECDALIALHKSKNKFLYRDTIVMDIEHELVPKIIVSHAQNKIIQWAQVVKWEKGAKQAMHLDMANPSTSYTTLTYLNDDFEGGETVFEDGTTIKPKTGRTLMFNGMKYVHGVNEIISGTRYTMPIWYQ